MGERTAATDRYIANAADFAQPILEHLRDLVHEALPDARETTKWGMPYFELDGPLCWIAAFKGHASFGFWKGSIVFGEEPVQAKQAMGHFGRITSLKDLPADATLRRYLRRAAKLAREGTPRATKRRPPQAIEVPNDLSVAFDRNRKAKTTFDGLAPGYRRDCIEWITGAKRPETRTRRLKAAIERLAKGERPA